MRLALPDSVIVRNALRQTCSSFNPTNKLQKHVLDVWRRFSIRLFRLSGGLRSSVEHEGTVGLKNQPHPTTRRLHSTVPKYNYAIK